MKGFWRGTATAPRKATLCRASGACQCNAHHRNFRCRSQNPRPRPQIRPPRPGHPQVELEGSSAAGLSAVAALASPPAAAPVAPASEAVTVVFGSRDLCGRARGDAHVDVARAARASGRRARRPTASHFACGSDVVAEDQARPAMQVDGQRPVGDRHGDDARAQRRRSGAEDAQREQRRSGSRLRPPTGRRAERTVASGRRVAQAGDHGCRSASSDHVRAADVQSRRRSAARSTT